MKKFESKQAITDYILEKTAPVFNRQGYIGSSLADLTKATGLTKGAVYSNFRNKEELALKAFQLNVKKYVLPLYAQINKSVGSIEKIYAIIIFFRNYYDSVATIGGCPILNVGIDAKYVNAKLFEASRKISKQMVLGLIQLIEQGIEKKELNPNIDAEKIAKTILVIIEGGNFLSNLHEDKEYMNIALDNISESIIPQLKI